MYEIKTSIGIRTVPDLSRACPCTGALGVGRQQGHAEVYRGVREVVNLIKKVRLEIAVNDEFVERTIEAIIKGARTGNIGDGKIFVLDLPECVRIRTGERGNKAIG